MVGGARPTSKSRLLTSLFTPDWRDRFLSCDTTTTPSRVSWQSSSRRSALWAMELQKQRSMRGRGMGLDQMTGWRGRFRGMWAGSSGQMCRLCPAHLQGAPVTQTRKNSIPWCQAWHSWPSLTQQLGPAGRLTSPWPPWCSPGALQILHEAARVGSWGPDPCLSPLSLPALSRQFRLQGLFCPLPPCPSGLPPPLNSALLFSSCPLDDLALSLLSTLAPVLLPSLHPQEHPPLPPPPAPCLPWSNSPPRWAPRRG